jgi:hypothetical protein
MIPALKFAILLLKAAGAMVLSLRLHVLQHGFQLTRAHRRKRAIAALPEKAAVASIKCFDPLRGYRPT